MVYKSLVNQAVHPLYLAVVHVHCQCKHYQHVVDLKQWKIIKTIDYFINLEEKKILALLAHVFTIWNIFMVENS